MYFSYLEFTVAGIDYSSLAASQELMAAFTAKIAKSTCGSVGLPAYNCSVVVFAGSVKVGVTIGGKSSYEDASSLAAALSEVNETLQTDVVDSVTNDTQIMAATDSISVATSELHVSIRTGPPQIDGIGSGPPPMDGMGASNGNEASATGDPHVSSVTGRKFDVNLPGGYVLIRAPQDPRLPAKLEVNATLATSGGAACGLYIKSIRLGGEWLANQLVDVRPLQRDVEGGNAAGTRTVRPFSVRIQEAAQLEAPGAEYEPWKDLDRRGRLLTGRVRLVPAWRQVHADAGRTQEAEAFRFNIRGEGAEQATSLEVAQGAHQALDVRAGGLRQLGFARIGGLLGTEEHDRAVEQFTDECKAQRMSAITSRWTKASAVAPRTSSMAASWDELV